MPRKLAKRRNLHGAGDVSTSLDMTGGTLARHDREESLETNLERWCYLFRNLNSFVETPPDQAGFEDLFSIAQTGELNENGISKYVTSMVTEYDRKVIGEYFFREGRAEGKAEGRAKGRAEGMAEGIAETKRNTARELRGLGVDVSIIAQATGLTESEIEAL